MSLHVSDAQIGIYCERAGKNREGRSAERHGDGTCGYCARLGSYPQKRRQLLRAGLICWLRQRARSIRDPGGRPRPANAPDSKLSLSARALGGRKGPRGLDTLYRGRIRVLRLLTARGRRVPD